MQNKCKVKVLLISSSGGHFDELRTLSALNDRYELIWVTEKVNYQYDADYYLIATGSKDILFPLKMLINSIKSIYIWFRKRPDFVISTGTMVAIPMLMISKFMKRKIVYIETIARINDGTKTGLFIYKYADLFIIQWESLREIYPNAVYGGSIF